MFFLTIKFKQIIIPFNTNFIKHCQQLGGSVLNVHVSIFLIINTYIRGYYKKRERGYAN